MRTLNDPNDIPWDSYPLVARHPHAKRWTELQVLLGKAYNTVTAYARGVEDFLSFCAKARLDASNACREDVAKYVNDLRRRPSPYGTNVVALDSKAGLANATLQQRLTAVRLFFDYLVEEGHRDLNPVSRGQYTPRRAFGGTARTGLIPRFKRLPWIPTEVEWKALLVVACNEPVRNRCMLALGYDAALRREELCQLESGDLDPANRLLHIRAETTKNRRDRTVPYSSATGVLLRDYLHHRRGLMPVTKRLFVSESRRNRAAPITMWTWSKVVRRLATTAELTRFSTHTLRHLCLTDLARAGWDLHEIARLAGHRHTDTTQQYIHLSGRDLAERFSRSAKSLHAARVAQLAAMTDDAARAP